MNMSLRRVAFLCLLLSFAVELNAQTAFSLYHASQIPQQNAMNPAFRSSAAFVFGLPGLSASGFQGYNSSFNLNQLLNGIEQSGDSATLNLNRTIQLFENRNNLSARVEQQWLFAAFRNSKSQLTFHINEQMKVRFSYPKDLFRLAIEGNGGANLGNTFNLKFSLNAIHYREFGLAYSRVIKENFIVGGRLKLLKGFTLLDASKMELNLNTSENQYDVTATSNIDIFAASTAYSLIGNNKTPRALNFFCGSNNPGMALDLGIVWHEHPRLSLSAALTDFGFINWKNNSVQFKSNKPNASFKFDGLPINPKKDEVGNYFEKLKDSINMQLGFDTIKGSFSRMLTSQIHCGYQYQINAKTSFQGLFYAELLNGNIKPAFHTGIRWQPCYWLYLMAHNTSFNNIWFNPGFGFTVTAGKTQVYASTEQLAGIAAADRTRSFSLKFGINLLWEKDERSIKRIKDPELLYFDQNKRETEDWGQ
jgi:hypothetical protein